jgi:uncharacterized repeat protein (TIGR01451 family)
MSRMFRVSFKLLDLLVILMMVFGSPLSALAAPSPTGATIASDLADYNPGGTVTLTGTGWAAGEIVKVVTNDTIGQTWQRTDTVTAAADGTFTDVFQLPNYFVSDYDVTATGPTSGAATTTFTDANASATLDQCANDPAPSPSSDGCSSAASDWINGNMGASKSVYYEGDSLPYRLTFDNLTLNSHTVTIEWDTTKGGTHALDYLTTYNRTVTTADPCLGVTNCGAATTFAIPADPQVTGAGVTPVAGNLTMFGGTITAVSAYSYANGAGFAGDKTARISITFTASQANPVLAWAGHISTRADWGANNSAVAIPGSPYHTRLIDLDGSGGNQDRSLSADAVIFPGSITIVKQATPEGATSFPFTASPTPLGNFSLVDDGTAANTKTFSNIINFQTYNVAESVPSGWNLTGITCSVSTPNGGSQTVSSPGVTINLNEGENVTCTFNNQVIFVPNPSLSITKVAAESGFSAVGDVIHYTIVATNTGNTTLASVTVTDAQVADLNCVPANGSSLAPGASMTCTATHTVTQADIDGGSFYNQACVDDGAGGATGKCADVTTPGTKNPALSITKVATESGYNAAGQVIHYTIVATNTGNTTLSSVTVTDAQVTDLNCTPVNGSSLTPGASMTCTASHTITQADLEAGSFYNQACVDDGAGGATGKCADVTTPGTQTPHLSITKSADPTSYSAVGQVITYTIVAINDGNITLKNVTVTDPSVSGLTCTPSNPADLAPGASINCTATHTITQADIDAGHYANTACADDGAGGADKACASVDVPGTQTPHLSITKSADPTSYSAAGQTITYTIVATNDGNVTLHNVTVSDPSVSGLTCTPANGSDLAPGATMNCTGTHTVTQADLDAGHYANTACVDDGAGGAAQACASKDVPGTQTPHLSITKVATETSYNAVGQVIHYTIVATNDGNVTLHNVTVSDPSVSGLTCTPSNPADLAPGASINCTATHTVTQADLDAGHYANTACVDDGVGGADQACATVDVPGTQNPHLSITKSADPTSYSKVGDVITYTIVATNDGNVTLHTVTVSDPSVTGLTCTPANGSDLTPGQSMNCSATHTISQTDLDAGHYANTACVDDGTGGADKPCASVDVPGTQNPAISLVKSGTWVDGNGNRLAEVGEVINYTFTVTNTGNVTLHNITLADTIGGVTISGGPIASLAPGASDSTTFTGTYTLTQADLDAGHFYNKATTCGLSPTDVQVCTDASNNVVFPPRLIVIKHVINDNGGTSVASDFAIEVSGLNVSPNNFQGSETGVSVALNPGSYTVGEAVVSGYSPSFSADCTGSIAAGQTKTCTITNNDQPARLIVIKHVINDNGGTALASSFTLDSGGTNDTPSNFPGSESGTTVTLDAGSYNVSETGPAGYAASYSSNCSGTIAVGQFKTCTVTNNDIAPSLTLVKTVTNDNGGTAVPTNFTLTATGTTSISGAGGATSGPTFKAGAYTLSETNLYGYTAGAWSCSKNGGSAVTGSSVTLGIADTATCTINNNDQPGTIVIIKNAKPAQGQFAFTTTGTSYNNGFTLTGATTNGGNQNSQTLNAGTYTIKEGSQLSWVLTGIGNPADSTSPYSCVVTGSGGSSGLGDLNTQTATVSLKNGDSVTCYFENTGNGATRTQGFWATHSQLANIAWFGGTAYGHTFPGVAGTSGIGDKTLCGRPIDTLGKLMGGFWSSVSTTSTGAKRSSLDQARMQLLQQLLAAELNASAFGSTPVNGSFSAWESAYCGTNQNAIKTAQQQSASFNSQGDNSTFTPGTSADSKNARSIATLTWWNVLP